MVMTYGHHNSQCFLSSPPPLICTMTWCRIDIYHSVRRMALLCSTSTRLVRCRCPKLALLQYLFNNNPLVQFQRWTHVTLAWNESGLRVISAPWPWQSGWNLGGNWAKYADSAIFVVWALISIYEHDFTGKCQCPLLASKGKSRLKIQSWANSGEPINSRKGMPLQNARMR